jgi:hypothetical protein
MSVLPILFQLYELINFSESQKICFQSKSGHTDYEKLKSVVQFLYLSSFSELHLLLRYLAIDSVMTSQ